MAVSYKSEGALLSFTAPGGGVTLNTPVLIGSVLVIPAVTAAASATFTGSIGGAWTGIAKATGEAWSEGEPLYWDDGNSRCTTVDNNVPIGVATAAAANPSSTGYVRLTGQVVGTVMS